MSGSLLTRVAARVELTTGMRAQGLIQGRGRSRFKGSGEDFDDLRFYQAGDKISDIDWKATARTGEPLIRQFNEARARHLSIVADTSAAMAATAADGGSKRDAMVTAAGIICYLAQQSGDMVALVAGDSSSPVQLPARASDGHLELLLQTIQAKTTLDSGKQPGHSGWLMNRALRVVTRPTLMTIITDDAHPALEDEAALRRLRTRHDIMVIRIADADPLRPEVMDRDVVDVRTRHASAETTRTSAKVARDVHAFRLARSQAITAMLARHGMSSVTTAGDSTVVQDVVRMLRGREFRRARS